MSVVSTTSNRLNLQSDGMSLDANEFDIADWDPEYRYELIHGVVVVSPIASEGEASPNDELAFLLRAFRSQHPQGACIDDTLPERHVHLPDGTRRRADRVIWTGLGRKPDPKIDIPSIVIEFVSRTTRDRHRDYIEKRVEYREVGVKEYWIIDRFERRMTVSFYNGTEKSLDSTENYRTSLMPGFELPLGRLIEIGNQWP